MAPASTTSSCCGACPWPGNVRELEGTLKQAPRAPETWYPGQSSATRRLVCLHTLPGMDFVQFLGIG